MKDNEQDIKNFLRILEEDQVVDTSKMNDHWKLFEAMLTAAPRNGRFNRGVIKKAGLIAGGAGLLLCLVLFRSSSTNEKTLQRQPDKRGIFSDSQTLPSNGMDTVPSKKGIDSIRPVYKINQIKVTPSAGEIRKGEIDTVSTIHQMQVTPPAKETREGKIEIVSPIQQKKVPPHFIEIRKGEVDTVSSKTVPRIRRIVGPQDNQLSDTLVADSVKRLLRKKTIDQ